MKIILKKRKENKDVDDTLFGLLSLYKKYSTYFRILVNEEKKRFVLIVVDNPKKWQKISEEVYSDFRMLKRVEMNCNTLFVKYLLPEHILANSGHTLGLKLPTRRVVIENKLGKKDEGYFLIEASMRYLANAVYSVKKIITYTPQKKYEIIEKYYAQNELSEG